MRPMSRCGLVPLARKKIRPPRISATLANSVWIVPSVVCGVKALKNIGITFPPMNSYEFDM